MTVVLIGCNLEKVVGLLVLPQKKTKVKWQKTNSNLVNVFVPTTPNPTSGFLFNVFKNEVIYLLI